MLKCLLAPAALLYKAGVTFRHRLFDWGVLKSEKFDIPVVCIGNITVGGTGKTPMAEMVIAYMSQMHNVALLSRGYGRRTKGYREVKTDSHYRDVGDEPLQIKLKFPGTVVVVCEKRAEGIRRIRAEHPEVDLIIMMKFVALTTKKYALKTTVSLNALMVDGTGMCGACRVTVAGRTRFTCVEGPEFDGHEVDFDEAMRRQGMYRTQEQRAAAIEAERQAGHQCKIGLDK